MSMSFYFYDLETSGFNPREARIMQFGGQRTDLELKPIGEPHNFLIKMTEDIVPDPDAVLITGITPQKTVSEGLPEAEFLKIFHQQISLAGTIFVGFNSIRFDDEFMRYLNYRNFHEPYEWQWQAGRSRWDLLDVVRMMRALRPEGINWPFSSDGQPANRLELLTKVNNINHGDAHDALSDVMATIGLARLVRKLQPKLFDYLLSMRDKKTIAKLVNAGRPFMYTSGKYSSEWQKTTAVAKLTDHPSRGVLVFDLRFDPNDYINLSAAEMVAAWTRRRDDPGIRLPIKTLQFNRCPVIAPISVLDKSSQSRLGLSPKVIEENFAKLQKVDITAKVLAALELLEKQRQAEMIVNEVDVDAQLYEGFIDDQDRRKLPEIQIAKPKELSKYADQLKDNRLKTLLPLYKARNYPKALTSEEQLNWEQFRERRLLGNKTNGRLAKYFNRLAELAEQSNLTKEQHYLLEELQLWGQTILPEQSLA